VPVRALILTQPLGERVRFDWISNTVFENVLPDEFATQSLSLYTRTATIIYILSPKHYWYSSRATAVPVPVFLQELRETVIFANI
jgi:hypothetical protein